MRSRVIPGSSVTMARRVPVRRLNSVDLPTFGRPTITSDGSFCAIEEFQVYQRASGAILQSSNVAQRQRTSDLVLGSLAAPYSKGTERPSPFSTGSQNRNTMNGNGLIPLARLSSVS